MTALGTHEHFQCDQCRTTIRVRFEDLVDVADDIPAVKLFDKKPGDGPLRPRNWLVLDLHSGGGRLSGIKHLCSDCRNSLDRHLFGPRRCDAPTIEKLEALLKKALPLLTGTPKDDYDFLRADIDGYFNPFDAVEVGDET